jgi:hypothetical protein
MTLSERNAHFQALEDAYAEEIASREPFTIDNSAWDLSRNPWNSALCWPSTLRGTPPSRDADGRLNATKGGHRHAGHE